MSSAYHFVKEREELKQLECFLRSGDSALWSGIWRMPIANAMKNFIWRACQNLLPTKENLMRRKVVNDPMCHICSLEVETTFHIIWGCPSAQDVLGQVLESSKRVYSMDQISSKLQRCFSKNVARGTSAYFRKQQGGFGFDAMHGYTKVIFFILTLL